MDTLMQINFSEELFATVDQFGVTMLLLLCIMVVAVFHLIEFFSPLGRLSIVGRYAVPA